MKDRYNARTYSVYILTNTRRGSLYIGVTNNLVRRLNEHRMKVNKTSYSACKNTYRLVYYEESRYVLNALEREKALKDVSRKEKIEMIERLNPKWNDLSEGWPGVVTGCLPPVLLLSSQGGA